MIWACENHSEPAQGPICSSHTYTFRFPSGRGLRAVAFYVSGHGITGSQPQHVQIGKQALLKGTVAAKRSVGTPSSLTIRPSSYKRLVDMKGTTTYKEEGKVAMRPRIPYMTLP